MAKKSKWAIEHEFDKGKFCAYRKSFSTTDLKDMFLGLVGKRKLPFKSRVDVEIVFMYFAGADRPQETATGFIIYDEKGRTRFTYETYLYCEDNRSELKDLLNRELRTYAKQKWTYGTDKDNE